MSRKISELPVKEFSSDMIDNCFYVDKTNTNQMSVVDLQDVFDWIKETAIKEGLKVEFTGDRILFIKRG